MDGNRRRSVLRTTFRAGALALATMTLATTAWAGQATTTTKSQAGPTTTIRLGPTTTTKIGSTTTTKIGPSTTKSSAIQNPLPGSIPVTVTPQAAGAGTTVKLAANVRGCDLVHTFFYDRKSKGSGVNGGGRPLARPHISGNRWLAAEYTVTKRDAIGQGRFGVLCNLNHDNYREGYASFQVTAGGSSSAAGSGDNPSAGTNNSAVQDSLSDTGLGGTAARTGGGGLVWWLLPAALLLVVAVAAALRLRRPGS
jgi:hypothetical protein